MLRPGSLGISVTSSRELEHSGNPPVGSKSRCSRRLRVGAALGVAPLKKSGPETCSESHLMKSVGIVTTPTTVMTHIAIYEHLDGTGTD